LVAGAAAAAAAAAYIGRRRLSVVRSSEPALSEPRLGPPRPSQPRPSQPRPSRPRPTAPELIGADLIESESAELPVGRSADPEIDDALVGAHGADDETSGGLLRGEYEAPAEVPTRAPAADAALDEIWNSLPGFAEGEQTEGYDAVTPEDLGAVWLERATQTTHETRPHANDPSEVPELENLLVSESTLLSSNFDEDESEEIDIDEDIDEDLDDEGIDEDDDRDSDAEHDPEKDEDER